MKYNFVAQAYLSQHLRIIFKMCLVIRKNGLIGFTFSLAVVQFKAFMHNVENGQIYFKNFKSVSEHFQH